MPRCGSRHVERQNIRCAVRHHLDVTDVLTRTHEILAHDMLRGGEDARVIACDYRDLRMMLIACRCLLSAKRGDKEGIIELADAVADVAPDACGTLVFKLAVALNLIVEEVAVIVRIPCTVGIDRGGGIEVVPVDEQCLAVYLGCRLRTRFLRDSVIVCCDIVCSVEIISCVVLDVTLEVDRGRCVLHKGCTRFLCHADLAEVVPCRIDEIAACCDAVRIR